MGSRISNRGTKKKLKERKRAPPMVRTTHHQPHANKPNPKPQKAQYGKSLSTQIFGLVSYPAPRLLRRRWAECHRCERRSGRYRQLPRRDAVIMPLRTSRPKESVFQILPFWCCDSLPGDVVWRGGSPLPPCSMEFDHRFCGGQFIHCPWTAAAVAWLRSHTMFQFLPAFASTFDLAAS